MAQIDLPYLWAAKGRGGRLYWYYRRGNLTVPIKSPEGRRLASGDVGFMEAYERIHASFEIARRPAPSTGTLSDLINKYRADVEYRQLKPTTWANYDRWLNWLAEHHGHRRIADFPREAALQMRKEHMATPSAANRLLKVLNLILNYAEEHPLALGLPKGWLNPLHRIKRLKEGEGHIPWEEDEIDAFRARWPSETPVRVMFELFLNTGQRGIDIATMKRTHYRCGEISVVQEKTGERVRIPVADDLRAVLDPWLASGQDEMFFPTAPGRSIAPNYMRKVMRDAIRIAGLPETRTLHGLRYTFATRASELGMDYPTIESIVGHKTQEMASKYTKKRRRSRLAIVTWNVGLKRRSENRLMGIRQPGPSDAH
jgi:integrase